MGLALSFPRYRRLANCKVSGRFRGPSGRAPFSDEGGFTFSEALFEGTLHEDLKGASPSEFFLAHAVRARGSDGHQNVLWFSVWQHCKCSQKEIQSSVANRALPKLLKHRS